MDVTNNLGGQITAAMAALPAEVQPLIQTLMDRLDALEAKTAADAANLETTALAAESSAEDKLLAAEKPLTDFATTMNGIFTQMANGKLRLVVSMEPVTQSSIPQP
jgi:hypothetical protein